MTKSEYANEMRELCLKLSEILKLLEENGLFNFYHAASNGFEEMLNNYTQEAAEALISKEEIAQIESTKAYIEELRQEASEKGINNIKF